MGGVGESDVGGVGVFVGGGVSRQLLVQLHLQKLMV